jgi:hypothetical protein
MEDNDKIILEKIVSIIDENNHENDISVLENWVNNSKNFISASKTFYFPSFHIEAYIRLTNRFCNLLNKKVPALEIASIEVDRDSRSKGYGSKFIDYFEKVAFDNGRNVYIELVHSPILENLLKKKNYLVDSYLLDPYSNSSKIWWNFI